MIEHPRDSGELAVALRQLATLESFEGVEQTASARVLLLHFASGDLERPLPSAAADWDEIFLAICRNGLVGLTQRYLASHADKNIADAPPEAFRRMIARAHSLNALRLAVHCRAVEATLADLIDVGLDPLVLKGPAIARLVYPDPVLRTYGDLDLLIREREIAAVHHALLAQGFEAEHDPSELPPRLIPQLTAYELKYWHPSRQLLVEVHVDDPFSMGLVARDLEAYWQRAVPISIGKTTVRTLSLEDQLLQLCSHAHYHSYTRLNWLSDLAFLVREHGAALDWGRVVATTRLEALQVPVFYSLHILRLALGVDTPANILAMVRPNAFRRWWHERYLPESSILEFGPSPRPFAGFYFLPFRSRLLPDLLVMGRHSDKLRCLVRLLVPAPAWLRAYYQLPDSRPVGLHYFLHPLKLLVHALAEFAPRLLASARSASLVGRWTMARSSMVAWNGHQDLTL